MERGVSATRKEAKLVRRGACWREVRSWYYWPLKWSIVMALTPERWAQTCGEGLMSLRLDPLAALDGAAVVLPSKRMSGAKESESMRRVVCHCWND